MISYICCWGRRFFVQRRSGGSGDGGGLRAWWEDGNTISRSSHHLGNEVHVLVASADIWPCDIKSIFKVVLESELVHSPPSGGDEVPGIIGSVDNSASESVDTLQHVEGESLCRGGKENVQSGGENVNGSSNELLERSIGESSGSSNWFSLARSGDSLSTLHLEVFKGIFVTHDFLLFIKKIILFKTNLSI